MIAVGTRYWFKWKGQHILEALNIWREHNSVLIILLLDENAP